MEQAKSGGPGVGGSNPSGRANQKKAYSLKLQAFCMERNPAARR